MTCLDPLLQPLSHLRNFTMRIRVHMSPVDLETHRTQSKLKLLGITGSPRKQDGSGSNLVYVNDTAQYIYIYIKGVTYPTIKWKTPIKTRINKTVISIEPLSLHDCWSISRCCIFQVAAQAITSAGAGPSGTPKGNHFRDRGALSLFKYSVMESWNHEDLESCKVASRILIVIPNFLMIHDFLCLCS